MTFVDEGSSDINSLDQGSYYSKDSSEAAPLATYLERPVRILSMTWNETDPIKTITLLNPFYAFVSNPSIQRKIQNYAFIRFSLKIKVIVNASPFYYGAMLMYYHPLQAFKTHGIQTTSNNLELVPYSQFPHVWIYPQENKGVEMTLPFLLPVNYFRTAVAQDFQLAGELVLVVYAPLRSANGAVGQGVSIQVFAHAENVEMSGPTMGLMLQGDEYQINGPVSKIASAVSSVASRLSDVPVIGKFARATQLGASAIGHIASLFGFSRIPYIGKIVSMRPIGLPPLAPAEGEDGHDKLTVDPKNELTIDPRIFGGSGIDELNIQHYCGRESWLGAAQWATTTAVDTIIADAPVHPQVSRWQYDSVTPPVKAMYLTPMGHMSHLFQYWRGSIIFRFVIIASPFHKGRLRFVYDPYPSSTSGVYQEAGEGSVLRTEIFDIGVSREFEVEIPYHQPTEYLRTRDLFNNYTLNYGNNDNIVAPGIINGQFALKVQTLLSAPVADAPVSVQIFIRAGKDFELAAPKAMMEGDLSPNFTSAFPLQGETIKQSINNDTFGSQSRHLIYMGERIVSAAPLMKRLCFVASRPCCRGSYSGGANHVSSFRFNFNQLPVTPGYIPVTLSDSTALASVAGIITTGTNYAFQHAFWSPLTWLSQCFLGRRGSINYDFNVIYNNNGISPCAPVFKIYRQPAFAVTEISGTVYYTVVASGTEEQALGHMYDNTGSGIQGSSATSMKMQSNGSVNLPMYSNMRFYTTELVSAFKKKTTNWIDNELSWFCGEFDTVEGLVRSTHLQQYCGAGPDYSVGFFLCVPTLWVTTTIPG